MYSERNTTTPHPSSDDLGIENGELIAIVGMSKYPKICSDEK
jgi:hypothetical protein